jgi:hypothetical protein
MPAWGPISVDEELGMAYLLIELLTGDIYGGHQPGNGLFGEARRGRSKDQGAQAALPVGPSWNRDFDIPRADPHRHHD